MYCQGFLLKARKMIRVIKNKFRVCTCFFLCYNAVSLWMFFLGLKKLTKLEIIGKALSTVRIKYYQSECFSYFS